MEWTQEKMNEVYEKIAKKCAEDRAYRDAALEDPKKTIENEAGIKLPDNMKINFIEDKANELAFILPEFQGDELNDDDLENVAGGRGSRNPRRDPPRCAFHWTYDDRLGPKR